MVAAPTLSVEASPRQADLAAFRVPPGVFLKLHRGTWHAGAPQPRAAAVRQRMAAAAHAERRHTLLAGALLRAAAAPLPAAGSARPPARPADAQSRDPCTAAGPLFDGESADFYNLELSDTNVTDHNTHDYATAEGLQYEVVD